ncbi:MAG TPA: YggS family pyridoxal phosphate-dependent enzyme [Pyrinomonadaceae bacterium]|nr:YggS family pyridoxal phosphate-dependent enzyme [Pyrinomonadaceae bacterium]
MGLLESTADELRLRVPGVWSRIEAAAKRSGRTRDAVKLICVSKTHPADVVRAAIEAGVTDLGENRVQEAEPKIGELGREAATWHLIGHLQSNKARRAVQLFDMIHSIDSVALVEKLDRACADLHREQLPVLIQVDLGHETTKSGADESELPELIGAVTSSEHLKLIGFMTLPPFFEDAESTRPFFAKLRELRDEYQQRGVFGASQGELSMGMTHDFEVAIEEGATMVRIGTAIFGARETA